jgi:hypothetical protein
VRATCHQVWERFPARQPTSTYVPKHVRHVTYGGDHVMAKGWHLRATSASNLSHGSSHGNVRQGTASHHANHRLSPKYGCACTWERWFRRSPTPTLGLALREWLSVRFLENHSCHTRPTLGMPPPTHVRQLHTNRSPTPPSSGAIHGAKAANPKG